MIQKLLLIVAGIISVVGIILFIIDNVTKYNIPVKHTLSLIIFGLLLLLIIVSLSSLFFNSKEWILPLLAGFLVLFGTAIGLYLTFHFRTESKRKQVIIEDLTRDNKKLSDKIFKVSKKIKKITKDIDKASIKIEEVTANNNELASKNIELANKTIELNTSIKGYTIGSEKPFIIEFKFDDQNEDGIFLDIVHIDEIPFYDFHVTITENYLPIKTKLEMMADAKIDVKELTKKDKVTSFKESIVPNKTIFTFGKLDLPMRNGWARYTLKIQTRNNFFFPGNLFI